MCPYLLLLFCLLIISAQDTSLGLGQKMAELAGLIIGGISLTALFDQCISIISHVSSGMHCSDVY